MRHASTLAFGDTAEWDDTDREVVAQGTVETTPLMFEDTGVLIVEASLDPDPAPPSDHFAVTFRNPMPADPDTARTRPGLFGKKRASTVDDWPPAPRAPAVPSSQIRERTFRRAAVYTIVHRDETKN